MSVIKEVELNDVKKVPIMFALILGGFTSILSETLLNVALPKFMVEFGISANTASWLITGYLLVIGVCVPAAGYFMQKFTTRVLFFSALTIFAFGSIVAATAQNFPILLFGRLVQAVGTAIQLPLFLNVILALNPPEKRGAANGLAILVVMFAPAIGPTLSGVILMYFSWRALFFCMLPLSLISFVVGLIYMRDVTKTSKPKFDLVSMIFSTFGFGLFIYGLSLLGGSASIGAVCIVCGVLCLVIFALRQFRLPQPMLDLRVFKFSTFTVSVIFTAIAMMSLFSNLMVMPIFLQKVLLLSTFTTGLVFMPGGFLNGFAAPVVGKIYDKFGSKYLFSIGFFLMFVSLLALSQIDANTTIPMIILILCILNIGVPLVMTSAQTSGLNSLSAKYYPHGTAVLNTFQQVSAAFGSSFFIMVMTGAQTKYLSNMPASTHEGEINALTYGVSFAYKVGSGFILAAFILSICILLKKKVLIKE